MQSDDVKLSIRAFEEFKDKLAKVKELSPVSDAPVFAKQMELDKRANGSSLGASAWKRLDLLLDQRA